jgi:hypothetical protein
MTIVAFSGRLKSGKTTLAQPFIDNGYIKVSFADVLKESLSSIYNLDSDYFYNQDLKNKIFDKPFIYDEKAAIKLSQYFNLDIIKLWKDCDYKEMFTIRDMMQYVGTNILRRYDYDFHVKKTIEKLDVENNNYVFDDVRFFNELESLRELKAYNIFVIRPWFMEYSNHKSEIDLSFYLFDSVIVNDSSFDVFKTKSVKIFNDITNNTFVDIREKFNSKQSYLRPKNDHRSYYKFFPILNYLHLNDGHIIFDNYIKYFDKIFGFSYFINDPYFVETLKLFDIEFDENNCCKFNYPLMPHLALDKKSYMSGLFDFSNFVIKNNTDPITIRIPANAKNKTDVIDAICFEFEAFDFQKTSDSIIVPTSKTKLFLEYIL